MILLVIILIILLILIIYYEPYFFKEKIKNSSEYGSARFSTFKEIKKNFKKENISNINETGFPIYYSSNCKNIWFDTNTPHYIYLGSTGSGKSVTCVIPCCSFIANAKIKRSVFITDPKGEIFNTTSKMFKNNGYDIYTIDFRNPELSNKINLLEPIIQEYEKYIMYNNEYKILESDINCINTEIYINNNYDNQNKLDELNDKLLLAKNNSMKHLAETNRLITSLSSIIMKEKGLSKDPFWNNSAKNLLEGLISLFLEEYQIGKIKRNQLTLTSIRKFQNSSMDETNFEILKNHIDKKQYGCKSKDSLTALFSANENTYKSITATFGAKMALFDDINVANITSSNDFSFDILGKKNCIIYLIIPDEDKTYYPLITMIVGLMYRELVKLANNQPDKKLPVQIDWILDEFANCPPLEDIEAIVSVARSRGMRFHFFIQSLSQLDNVYGKEISQIILDNCGLIYLKTNTQETAEAISKRLGKKTIEAKSISHSTSNTNYSGNTSTSLIGRDLLTPDEVKQLHYKTIIFPSIGFPIFRDTVIYKKFSCYIAGNITRKSTPLKELADTYYTVENINNKSAIQKQELNMLLDNSEKDDFYEDMKLEFNDITTKIKDILENQKYIINYPIENHILHCSIEIYNTISGDDKEKIEKILFNQFDYEITINENTIINIYLKFQ